MRTLLGWRTCTFVAAALRSVARLHLRPERTLSVVAKLLGGLEHLLFFFLNVMLHELFEHGHFGFAAFVFRIEARNLPAARRNRPSDIRQGCCICTRSGHLP